MITRVAMGKKNKAPLSGGSIYAQLGFSTQPFEFQTQ